MKTRSHDKIISDFKTFGLLADNLVKGKCPKCKIGPVQHKDYGGRASMFICLTCGCSYNLGDSVESLERQVYGDVWANPRRPKGNPKETLFGIGT